MVVSTDQSLAFLLNGRQVCSPVPNVPDLLYPFVNLTGKLLRVSLR